MNAAAGEWGTGGAVVFPTGDKAHDLASRTVRWNLRNGSAELIEGFSGFVVSASGAIAGWGDRGDPAVWRDGRTRTLPLPPGAGNALRDVSGISADGHVVVGGLGPGLRPSEAPPSGNPVVLPNTEPVIWRGC